MTSPAPTFANPSKVSVTGAINTAMDRPRCSIGRTRVSYESLLFRTPFDILKTPDYAFLTSQMDFRYSDIVDPSTYDTLGLCDGIDLRRHRNPEQEELGAMEAQRDWAHLVGGLHAYKGGLGPKYSFMQVTVPESLPERLAIVSYANEFAFLCDGNPFVVTAACTS